MIRRILFWVSGFLPCRFIRRVPEEDYLERYYIGGLFGWHAYLHRFVAADLDEDTHDHPWLRAFALVLAGGYSEERLLRDTAGGVQCRTIRRSRGSINRLTCRTRHRITDSEAETWTLFVHGPWLPDGWGFWERIGPQEMRYRPYRIGLPTPWWPDAPRGRDAGRAPLATEAA